MKRNTFLLYCFMLIVLISQSFLFFRQAFSGVDFLKSRVADLENEVGRERLRVEIVHQHLSDYQQEVASLLPDAIRQTTDKEATYHLRTLASVIATPQSDRLQIERAAGLFEKGKNQFRLGKYDESNRMFSGLISSSPESIYFAEAHFLLSEGQYQTKDFEACVGTIEAMITLFPESELTGFALLRLGKIYEYKDRFEDAVEVYRAILNTYQEPALVTQARLNLKAVEL